MTKSYDIFITSDTHFGHTNMTKFLDYSGNRVRPFSSAEECDELMIENWNRIVKPNDKVYHLGDVVFNKNHADKIMPRLNGKKCLIKGNHDLFKPKWYLLWFYDIRACYNLENYLLTHIPVHPDSKGRFKRCLHGHTHSSHVLFNNGERDPWYRNVCMDSNNYSPVPFEEVRLETEELIRKGEIIVPRKMSKEERETGVGTLFQEGSI